MKRRRISKSRSRKSFKKSAGRSHNYNSADIPAYWRGGIRL